MEISVSPEIKNEVIQQCWADERGYGINHEALVHEWLLEELSFETERLVLI